MKNCVVSHHVPNMGQPGDKVYVFWKGHINLTKYQNFFDASKKCQKSIEIIKNIAFSEYMILDC